MEHENYANLIIFSKLIPSTVQIEDYISIDNNLLTENKTLIISDKVNCNEDNNLSIEQLGEHYESI